MAEPLAGRAKLGDLNALRDLVAALAALRPRPGSTVRYHTLLSLRELGRRAPVPRCAAGLLRLYGIEPDTAAALLIAAGDDAGRLPSEAARGRTCARSRPAKRPGG